MEKNGHLFSDPLGGDAQVSERFAFQPLPVHPLDRAVLPRVRERWAALEAQRQAEQATRAHEEDERRAAEERGAQEEAAHRAQEEAERQAEEERQRQEQEREERSRREAEERRQVRFQELMHLAEVSPHYLDAAHIEQYAKRHRQELLRERGVILHEYVALYDDGEFIAYVNEHDSRLIAWATWRAKALALAERLDVVEPPPPPPRKKLTAEEIRAFKVRREQVQADDKIALRKAKLDAILRARAFLDEYELGADERQMVEQDLIEDILKEDDEGKMKTL